MPSLTGNNKMMLVLMGLSGVMFDAFMQLASKTAPNVGLVNIFNVASITLITLLSAVFFKDKLNLQKIIGIVGVSLGIILLVI